MHPSISASSTLIDTLKHQSQNSLYSFISDSLHSSKVGGTGRRIFKLVYPISKIKHIIQPKIIGENGMTMEEGVLIIQR